MHAYRVSLGPAAVLVESQWKLERWADWWEPYGGIAPADGDDPADTADTACRFLVGTDVGTSDELGDDAEPLALHGGAVGIRTSGNNGVVVANIGRAALYHVGHDGVLALNYPDDADYWELDAFQIVRGLVMVLAERTGRRRLSGAALEREGTGLLLLGAGVAVTGRFLLPLLRSGAYGLVGNERLHVDDSGAVHGLPVATVASADLLPEVPQDDPAVRVADGSLVVWPGRLAAAFGVSVVPRMPLGAVVVCAPDESRADLDLSPLPAEDRPVVDGSAAPSGAASDGLVPQWLLSELGIPPPPPGGASVGSAGTALANVPWYRLTGDPTSPLLPDAIGELLS
ncbi:MAG TPA: hypothetical protein VI076_07115 [Actinopolymorphaceae bacterium]